MWRLRHSVAPPLCPVGRQTPRACSSTAPWVCLTHGALAEHSRSGPRVVRAQSARWTFVLARPRPLAACAPRRAVARCSAVRRRLVLRASCRWRASRACAKLPGLWRHVPRAPCRWSCVARSRYASRGGGTCLEHRAAHRRVAAYRARGVVVDTRVCAGQNGQYLVPFLVHSIAVVRPTTEAHEWAADGSPRVDWRRRAPDHRGALVDGQLHWWYGPRRGWEELGWVRRRRRLAGAKQTPSAARWPRPTVPTASPIETAVPPERFSQRREHTRAPPLAAGTPSASAQRCRLTAAVRTVRHRSARRPCVRVCAAVLPLCSRARALLVVVLPDADATRCSSPRWHLVVAETTAAAAVRTVALVAANATPAAAGRTDRRTRRRQCTCTNSLVRSSQR